MVDKHLSTGSAQRKMLASLRSATMILKKLSIGHLVRNLLILLEWALTLLEEAESFQPKTHVSDKLAAKSAINS